MGKKLMMMEGLKSSGDVGEGFFFGIVAYKELMESKNEEKKG